MIVRYRVCRLFLRCLTGCLSGSTVMSVCDLFLRCLTGCLSGSTVMSVCDRVEI